MQGVGLGLASGLGLRPAEAVGMLTLPRQTKAVRGCWDKSSHLGEMLLALNGHLTPFKAKGTSPATQPLPGQGKKNPVGVQVTERLCGHSLPGPAA